VKIFANFNKDINIYLLLLTFGVGLIIYNFSLPYPDCNDFYELSRICLLMDNNIKYCVNNNWGFAHPLFCWLTTKITGDLFISQRIISSLFSLLFVFVLLRIIRNLGIHFTKRNIALLFVFLCSPWMLEIVLSVHLDIISITFIFAAVLLILIQKKPFTFLIAGFIAGMAYWFRFHFLTYALLFPVLTYFLTKHHKSNIQAVVFTSIGSAISIIIPQLLCMAAYGVFSISNEKFVLAYALGIVDWTYESALKLETLNTIDLFRNFDIKIYMLKYGYHFIKSGLFPITILFSIFIFEYINKNKNEKLNFFDFSNKRGQLLLLSIYAFFTFVPFTLVRGFTYRLEAAFVFWVIPAILWLLTNSSKRVMRITVVVLLVGIIYQQITFWTAFIVNKATIETITNDITGKIPLSILKNEPERVICCVDYYNPYNKYHLCNPMVFAGWGVRFEPFIENFGFLNMSKPFNNEIYDNAKYLALPSSPTYFTYSNELKLKNLQLFKDNEVIILQR
jgi:hypothetical protein